MTAFLSAFGLVFLAELGDKSMLVVLTMTTRYHWALVVAAVVTAAVVLMGVAVAVGSAAEAVLPSEVVGIVAGVLFLGFGVWTLRGDDDDDHEDAVASVARSPVLVYGAITATITIAELGDKTQIAALSLAGLNPGAAIPVWLGAVLGMVAANLLAVVVGVRIASLVPERVVRRVAAALFILFGLIAFATVIV